jgi:hypothetical protein
VTPFLRFASLLDEEPQICDFSPHVRQPCQCQFCGRRLVVNLAEFLDHRRSCEAARFAAVMGGYEGGGELKTYFWKFELASKERISALKVEFARIDESQKVRDDSNWREFCCRKCGGTLRMSPIDALRHRKDCKGQQGGTEETSAA